jgi:hypothetical protein
MIGGQCWLRMAGLPDGAGFGGGGVGAGAAGAGATGAAGAAIEAVGSVCETFALLLPLPPLTSRITTTIAATTSAATPRTGPQRGPLRAVRRAGAVAPALAALAVGLGAGGLAAGGFGVGDLVAAAPLETGPAAFASPPPGTHSLADSSLAFALSAAGGEAAGFAAVARVRFAGVLRAPPEVAFEVVLRVEDERPAGVFPAVEAFRVLPVRFELVGLEDPDPDRLGFLGSAMSSIIEKSRGSGAGSPGGCDSDLARSANRAPEEKGRPAGRPRLLLGDSGQAPSSPPPSPPPSSPPLPPSSGAPPPSSTSGAGVSGDSSIFLPSSIGDPQLPERDLGKTRGLQVLPRPAAGARPSEG